MSLTVSPAEIVAASRSPLLAIANGWTRIKLGEVAEVINGYPFPSSGFNVSAFGEPVIRIRDVGKSEPSIWYQGSVTDAPRVSRGDIVIGMDGEFRAARWTGPTALLNQRVCVIRVSKPDVMDERFLLLALPGYLGAINEQTSSVTVKHLSSRTVADIPLPLPSLGEQRRIVEIIQEHFSRLDAADGQLNVAAKKADQLRLAAIERLIFTSSLPVELGDITTHLRNGTFISRPKANPPGVRILRISAVRPMTLAENDVRFADVSESDVAAFVIDEGDLLFTRYSGNPDYVGSCAVVPKMENKTIYPDKLIRLKLNRAKAIPEYVALALNYCAGRAQIEARLKTTAGQIGIAGSDLRSVKLHLPPVEEQLVALSSLDTVDLAVRRVKRDIASALAISRALRRSMLERAFQGAIPV